MASRHCTSITLAHNCLIILMRNSCCYCFRNIMAWRDFGCIFLLCCAACCEKIQKAQSLFPRFKDFFISALLFILHNCGSGKISELELIQLEKDPCEPDFNINSRINCQCRRLFAVEHRNVFIAR